MGHYSPIWHDWYNERKNRRRGLQKTLWHGATGQLADVTSANAHGRMARKEEIGLTGTLERSTMALLYRICVACLHLSNLTFVQALVRCTSATKHFDASRTTQGVELCVSTSKRWLSNEPPDGHNTGFCVPAAALFISVWHVFLSHSYLSSRPH